MVSASVSFFVGPKELTTKLLIPYIFATKHVGRDADGLCLNQSPSSSLLYLQRAHRLGTEGMYWDCMSALPLIWNECLEFATATAGRDFKYAESIQV